MTGRSGSVFLLMARHYMRSIAALLFSVLLFQQGKGQTVLSDTLPVTVYLSKFHLQQKVVRAEYGRAVMYFNQQDYLGKETDTDTLRITPKYFESSTIAELLTKGRAAIYRRSTHSFEDSITHRLKQYGSMADREFSFADGLSFFSNLERIGIMNAIIYDTPKKSKKKKAVTPTREKKFEYAEEFPDLKDTAAVTMRNYLPADTSRYYVYDLNNGYGEKDTNQCRAALVEGQAVFYFADCYAKYGIASIGSQLFGKGIYFYRHDSLFTIEAEYENDIPQKKIKEALPLLPARIVPGDSIMIHSFWTRTVITCLAHEDLQIKNILHPDCIKLKILEYWDDTIYLSYVWLQKGVGMVKWMRPSGSVYELIDHFYNAPTN